MSAPHKLVVENFASNEEKQTELTTPLGLCKSLLDGLTADFPNDCQPFAEAVEFPGYHDVIDNPMDLSIVEKHLSKNEYSDIFEFAKDMRLIFHNAITFNKDNSELNLLGKRLLMEFETRFQTLVNKVYPNISDQSHTIKQLEFAHIVQKLCQSDFNVLIEYINEQCPKALQPSESNKYAV